MPGESARFAVLNSLKEYQLPTLKFVVCPAGPGQRACCRSAQQGFAGEF